MHIQKADSMLSLGAAPTVSGLSSSFVLRFFAVNLCGERLYVCQLPLDSGLGVHSCAAYTTLSRDGLGLHLILGPSPLPTYEVESQMVPLAVLIEPGEVMITEIATPLPIKEWTAYYLPEQSRLPESGKDLTSVNKVVLSVSFIPESQVTQATPFEKLTSDQFSMHIIPKDFHLAPSQKFTDAIAKSLPPRHYWSVDGQWEKNQLTINEKVPIQVQRRLDDFPRRN